jgi:AcrR family transcriptional regulator
MTRARRISRTTVARAGARIVRRGGMDAVTLRAVADVVGVTPMALYRHVDDADDLRLATLDYVLGEVASPAPDGAVRDRLGGFARATRSVLGRYPGSARAMLTDWVALNQGTRIMESLLAVAAEHSPDPDRQVEIANAVFVYVAMRLMAEEAVLVRGRRRSLPAVAAHPERFPRLVETQARFGTIDTDRHFEVGLAALLDGLLDSR